MSTPRPLVGHADCPESLKGDNINVEQPDLRLPYVPHDFITLIEEPGRRLSTPSGVVSRMAYNFALAISESTKEIRLFIRTGSGEFNIRMPTESDFIQAMPSDQRFLMFCSILAAYLEGEVAASDKYQTAFLEGRLKKKKPRNKDALCIIEPKAKVFA